MNWCCCWDLKKGTIIVGYVTGGFSIACCIGSVVRLMIGLPMIMQNDDYQGQFPFNPLFFVFSAIYFAFHTVASFALVPAVKEISCTLYDNAMSLVILTFLIEGVAAYGREMFFIPNLVMLFVDVVLDITGIIVISTKFGKAQPYEDFLTSGLVIGCIILPILIYFSIIIIAHFEEVFRKSDKEPLQKSKFTGQQRMQASEHSDSDAGSGTIV